ncbi:Kunitz-type serine protease inhibitor bitisilin-3 [Nymphon striatum]|nr:Kunitz-type serine protease inhibitor bitisilin-3 [Nymphon striatum]
MPGVENRTSLSHFGNFYEKYQSQFVIVMSLDEFVYDEISFHGNKDNRSCSNTVCSYKITLEMKNRGCVPLYSTDDSCCPIKQVCPEEYVPTERNEVCKDPPSTSSDCARQGFTFNPELNTCFPGACPQSTSENYFLTPKECVDKCVSDYDYNICLQEVTPGACYATMERYHYNKTSNKCDIFTYYGCKGNMNNFITQDDCMKQCKDYKIALLKNACFDVVVFIVSSNRMSEDGFCCARHSCSADLRSIVDNTLFCIKKSCPEKPAGCTIRPQVLGKPTCCPTFACPGRDDRSSDFQDDSGSNEGLTTSISFCLVTLLDYIKSINNPFDAGIRLQNISTGADIPQEVVDGLLECLEIGEKSYEEFVKTRFQNKEKHLHDTIPTNRKTVFVKRTSTPSTVKKSMAKKDAAETIRYIDYARERGYSMLELLKYELTSTSQFLTTEKMASN